MLGMQRMLAQGVLAMKPYAAQEGEPVCSPRKILLAIRQELDGRPPRGGAKFSARLQQATREQRRRTSAKATRPWPRRTPYKPPKAPQLLKLSEEQKALIPRAQMVAA